MVEILGVPERRRARERRVRVEQRGHPSSDRSLRPGHRARHGALLLAREGDRDVRARRAYRFIRALRCEGEREESGRQRNGRGGSVGRSARIVSRLRIIGESGLRAVRGTPGPRAARGSGLGTHRDHGHLQHLRRDVRERPSKVLVTRRQRLLERVLHGAPLPLPATTVRLQCTAGAS